MNDVPPFRCRTHKVADLVMMTMIVALITAFLAHASDPWAPERVARDLVAQNVP